MISIKSKHAAMEMSVGTLVTIVLLMVVLGLGIFLIQKIFNSGGSFVDEVNTQVQSQIDTLFSENGDTRMVLIPNSKEISIPKGESGGIALSIQNVDLSSGTFSYDTSVAQIQQGCQITSDQAKNLIILGGAGRDIRLGSGDSMNSAVLIRFDIPETASLCTIRYKVQVESNSDPDYASDTFDLKIIS